MFELPRRYAEEMIAHAREEAPNECCGILAGKDGQALRLYRGVNAEQSPYRFNIDPQDLYRIHAEATALGWRFVAIYHSHPESPARPSEEDIRLALTPGVSYIIVSLQDADHPVIRSFKISDGVVTPEDVVIGE